MTRNGELEDRNGKPIEEMTPFVESSELVDGHCELEDESEESCVLYVDKQGPTAIDSLEDITSDSRYVSDYCETDLEFSHVEELLSSDAARDMGLQHGWDGESPSESNDSKDGRYSHLSSHNSTHAFVHDDSNLGYDDQSDIEIVEGGDHGNASHDSTRRVVWIDSNESPDRDDSDIVVVESRNLSDTYPRVSHEILSTVLCKVYLAYYSLVSIDTSGPEYFLSNLGFNLGSKALSDALRDLSPEELDHLRSKVRRILLNDINNAQVIESLVSLIDPHKIDLILCRKELKVVKFKDMIDRSTTSCMICYGSFRSNSMCTSLKCMHTFHSRCVRCWVKQSWCCPLCRCKDI